MYMYLGVCVCLYVCVHVCICEDRLIGATPHREQTQVLILTLYFETAYLEGSARLCLSHLTGAGITSIYHNALLSLYMGAGYPNVGPRAYEASALWTEPFPQPSPCVCVLVRGTLNSATEVYLQSSSDSFS